MIANAITCCRILISMLMFLFSVFSPEFYVCYLISGISDMIDVSYSAIFVCLAATFATIQEGHIIRSQ